LIGGRNALTGKAQRQWLGVDWQTALGTPAESGLYAFLGVVYCCVQPHPSDALSPEPWTFASHLPPPTPQALDS
jgi:hypothetical protein